MNRIDDLLSSISDELKQEQCVKDYFYYKNIVEKDTELKQLEEELKFHQKEMCKNKNNSDVYMQEKSIYDELRFKFENNPILIDYQIAKEEVYSLLLDIKNVLS